MDLALHARAEELLSEHRSQWASEGKLEELPPAMPEPRFGRRARAKPFPIPKPEAAPQGKRGSDAPQGKRGAAVSSRAAHARLCGDEFWPACLQEARSCDGPGPATGRVQLNFPTNQISGGAVDS